MREAKGGFPGETKYNYGLNNPVKYNDPTGHSSELGDFFSGFFLETFTNILWFDTPYREQYGASSTESSASLAGRVVADVVSIIAGAEVISAGAGIVVGGSGLSCVGTACALTPVAIGAGAVVAVEGAGMGVSGALNLGKNVALMSGKKPSINQLNQDIKKGKAPDGVTRVDSAKVPNEQPHVHLWDGSALNSDGTWKHGGVDLPKNILKWLKKIGWKGPQ